MDTKRSTSPNLLLIISLWLLVCIAIAWILFEQNRTPPPATAIVTSNDTPTAESVPSSPIESVRGESVEEYLYKAHLAVEADMLYEPAGQNALYFLGLVLSEVPDHTAANSSVDNIATQLHGVIEEHIGRNEFVRAYRIAEILSRLRPKHALINDVRHAVRERTETLLDQSLTLSESGDRRGALDALAAAEALPIIDRAKLEATQEELQARLTAYEAAVAEQQRQQAMPEWLKNAQAALTAEQLIEPAEGNALLYLQQADTQDPTALEFRVRLEDAILAAAEMSTLQGRLDESERLLIAAGTLDIEAERLAPLQAAHQRAQIDKQASEPIGTSALRWRKRVMPIYPRNADRDGIEGRVDVAFTVTTSGDITDIVVLASEPGDLFVQAAIQAVQQWRFDPHEVSGVVVNQRVATRLTFTSQ